MTSKISKIPEVGAGVIFPNGFHRVERRAKKPDGKIYLFAVGEPFESEQCQLPDVGDRPLPSRPHSFPRTWHSFSQRLRRTPSKNSGGLRRIDKDIERNRKDDRDFTAWVKLTTQQLNDLTVG